MKANPGGQIDLQSVVGRDEVIEHIWSTLEQQSIRMNAERRIGKTTIIKKLHKEPKEGWLPIFQDLEQYHTAAEFSGSIFREVEKHLSKFQRTANRALRVLNSIQGLEISGVLKLPTITNDTPWKEILTSSIQDLIEGCEQKGLRPLFLWDEVPFMLENIKDRDGEQVAMEVLDALRGLRQTFESRGLRMIITGSIGLHHVINNLQDNHYANAPMNDTLTVPIEPLTLDAAKELAGKLMIGEDIQSNTLANTTTAIAKASDCFPFYIHHIIKAIKRSGLECSPELVESTVNNQLLSADDPWELNHYRVRISTDYGKEHEKAVIAILDSLALTNQAMPLNTLLKELKSTGELDDRELLIKLLKLIEQDHYLTRNTEGHYYFQFPLLQRWWKLARGL